MIKITKKNKARYSEFGTLHFGDTFIDDNEDEKLYIVLHNDVLDSNGDRCNVYNVTDNDVDYFDPYDIVIPVTATLSYEVIF